MRNLHKKQKTDFIYGNDPNFIIETNLFFSLNLYRVHSEYTGEIWNVMFVCTSMCSIIILMI